VSRDARGDASGEVSWHSCDAFRPRWLVGYLEFYLVKADLTPETMTERHLGPLWDRSVKGWAAKSSKEVAGEGSRKGCSRCEGTQISSRLNEEKEKPAAPWHSKRAKWEMLKQPPFEIPSHQVLR
jgi:hypothetical protein